MARHLLQHERWSVERVADALGYSESAAFSRAFSRWMGVSPLSYKNDSALRISDGG
jgi:AraC-like DNA-binding protein